MKNQKQFILLLERNVICSKEDLREMARYSKKEAVLWYFAGCLCKTTATKFPMFKTNKKIAEELGISELNFKTIVHELSKEKLIIHTGNNGWVNGKEENNRKWVLHPDIVSELENREKAKKEKKDNQENITTDTVVEKQLPVIVPTIVPTIVPAVSIPESIPLETVETDTYIEEPLTMSFLKNNYDDNYEKNYVAPEKNSGTQFETNGETIEDFIFGTKKDKKSTLQIWGNNYEN